VDADQVTIARKQVSEHIRCSEPELVRFLSRYLQQRSVNLELGGPPTAGQEEACQEWLAQELRRWNTFDTVDLWSVSEGRPNLAAVLEGAAGGRSLLLNGHSDVVPVPEDLVGEWREPPWSGTVRNGLIFGRGASDMKGPNAAFLMAARAIRAAGVRLAGDVVCTVVVGEESGNKEVGCSSVLNRGYTAPLCIVAEPTNLAVIPTITGELYLRILVRGRSTHLANRPACIWPRPAGEDLLGVNAIEKMWKVLGALMELERDWGVHVQHPAMPPGHMTLNIATVRGGEFISSLPGECEAVISVLFPPRFTVQEIQEELEAVVQRVAMNDLWLREHPPVIEAPYMVPGKQPVDHHEDAEGYQALCQAFLSALGREASVAYASFTSDANFLDEQGQPCIMFGPGDLSMGTHGSNEHVLIADLVAASHVYAHIMIDWCGVASVTEQSGST
jgi:acetylornithine deacetylase/succinyl-diaminopimelate desuccinylase family protein